MNKDDTFPSLDSDFNIAVEEEDGHTVVTAALEHPAERCYQLFCDADQIPKWLWVVGTSNVQQRDELGRALEVDFIGSLERASISYSLSYTYDDEARKVTWHRASGSIKELAGSASFSPRGEQACQLRYQLHATLSGSLPPWADGLYRQRPAETVVIDFCEWVDRSKGGEEG